MVGFTFLFILFLEDRLDFLFLDVKFSLDFNENYLEPFRRLSGVRELRCIINN